jgi:hypothetical protein
MIVPPAIQDFYDTHSTAEVESIVDTLSPQLKVKAAMSAWPIVGAVCDFTCYTQRWTRHEPPIRALQRRTRGHGDPQ